MTDDPHDYIAISDRGVIGCCSDDGWPGAELWAQVARDAGYRVERVPVEEAVRRHRAYLATLPEFEGLIPASEIEATADRQDAPAA